MLIIVARWIEHVMNISRCFRLGIVAQFIALQEAAILHLESYLDEICASIAILTRPKGSKYGPGGTGKIGKRIY